ncbi:MAG: pantetheine-phosphate adenylyltransferase [Myxococcales bacterium]|nr:pantetheine-phosphate adenylyltransferase [Myxococcales bacterium]
MRTALFAGSFDPITLGHVDVIRRGLALFDGVVVGIGHNPKKSRLLSLDVRIALVQEACAGLGAVRVEAYEGLTVDFAKKLGATAILRGLRDGADLTFEAPYALANRVMAPAVETVFLLADPSLMCVSSSLMREVVAAGGDASPWLRPGALVALRAALLPR